MPRTLKELKDTVIISSQGDELGQIKDFYFDDEKWIVRYLVVDCGRWYDRREVLISPFQLSSKLGVGGELRVNLTKEQIRGCPTPDDRQTVSRMYEEKYSRYYQLPLYWSAGDGLWPNGVYPTIPMDKEELNEQEHKLNEDIATNHLRSYGELLGYRIHASDDVFGKVKDMVLDTDTFQIIELIFDTGTFLKHHTVQVNPDWIKSINWTERELFTQLGREDIRRSPEWRA